MVVRKDSRVDAFHRQISALRHQLGGDDHDVALPAPERRHTARAETPYHLDFAVLDDSDSASAGSAQRAPNPIPVPRTEVALSAIPAADSLTSVIAHTTTWNGALESSGSLHVHGRVDGSLTAQDDVYVAEEADVDATITAANVTIAGNVRGTIRCGERFEVLPRGRVAGDIHAPVIVIHEGAILVGEISMAPTAESRASTVPPTRVARGGD
ncbi:MAG: polymer-forming cytoskeletal protein [Chloroflexi bacterium]|nr:polymer-forming cytoskeletal protein [Chloroflexota bacterium]